MVGLGNLPGGGFGSFALGVSANGTTIVGRGAGNAGAFIWDELNGINRLSSVLTAQGDDLTGWKLEEANGISADGRTIVGRAINPSGETEGFWARLETNGLTPTPTPLPVPSTLLLYATGLLGIVGNRWRRKKAK